MSLQAELVRLGLRWLLKRGSDPPLTIAQHRQQIERFERWVPAPPAGTRTVHTPLGGVPAVRIATRASRPDRHILFLHGGGYVTGSPALYRQITWRIAGAAGARLAALDYRLAPEHPFPAALDDAVAAWRGLLAEGADPRRACILGDSAGGGLALALALRLRDEREPPPAAIVALSPWTDLALTGASMRRDADDDPMQDAALAARFAACYLAGADPRQPYASPLYGDPAGLSPTLIQVGSDEMLCDDAARMGERMRAAGCQVELEVWPRMPHVWHVFAAVMPEARRAIARIGSFMRQHTDTS